MNGSPSSHGGHPDGTSPARTQRLRRRRRRRLLLQGVRHRTRQAAARVRELRDRRSAAEARPPPGRDRRDAQSPRRRGGEHRRGHGRRPPASRATVSTPRPRTASPVATRCRTRSGWTIPTARPGRSTRCSATAMCTRPRCGVKARAAAATAASAERDREKTRGRYPPAGEVAAGERDHRPDRSHRRVHGGRHRRVAVDHDEPAATVDHDRACDHHDGARAGPRTARVDAVWRR